jgi:two-component system CheB/CheR fusion protein
MPQDVGRRFDTFAHDIEYPTLLADVQEVLTARRRVEREVQTAQGEMLLVRLLPYRSHGDTRGVVLTVVDIATLKRAEAEARRLSAIVKSAREAIIATDLSGRIVAWNQGAEEQFGYNELAACGMDVRLLLPEDRRERELDLLVRASKGENIPTYETQRVTRTGSRVDVEISLTPVLDALGKVTGVSSIARDITIRKQAEEQAQRTIAQREQFLALLSHELRNPLMGLANAVRVLSKEGLSQAAQNSAREVVRRQVQQMARLLEDLLDSSRMRRDRIELNREVMDLRSTVDSVLDAARPQADEAGVTLALDIPPEPIEVEADIARLQQLQVNLLNNAIRYSPHGSTVTYSMRRIGGEAVVVVEDQGDGIAPEVLPHIFEPFFQAGYRRPGQKGMGLGLSLARAIALAHGGDIAATSDGPGKGARVEVRIPLAAARQVAVPIIEPRVETNPRLVLLIDDDVDSRELLGVLLEHAGHDVIQAGTAREGLDLLLSHRPRAAIVDIGLPDMSGLELARRARTELGSDGTKLIALTGFGQQKDRDAAAEAGFDHHLVKPLDFDTIETVLHAED